MAGCLSRITVKVSPVIQTFIKCIERTKGQRLRYTYELDKTRFIANEIRDIDQYKIKSYKLNHTERCFATCKIHTIWTILIMNHTYYYFRPISGRTVSF